jgi:hypothetical protein
MSRLDLAWKAWHKGADAVVFKPLLGPDELRAAVQEARQKTAESAAVGAVETRNANEQRGHRSSRQDQDKEHSDVK